MATDTLFTFQVTALKITGSELENNKALEIYWKQHPQDLVIVAGNPGVPRDNLYPTRTKPVPVYTGTGFCG